MIHRKKTSSRNGLTLFAIQGFVVGRSLLAAAAEAPNVIVTQTDLRTIYTATPATSALPGFKPHINFPYMKARADGTLEVDATVGQTQSSARFGIRATSIDGGRTWTSSTAAPSAPNSSIIRSAGQFSYGVSFAVSSASGTSSWGNTRYISTNGGANWSFENASFNTGSVLYSSIYNNLGDIVQDGANFYATGYGPRQGDSKIESVLFASNNNGISWTRRSTIAAYTNAFGVGMGSEGPSETALTKLTNGNLLAVYRTGQPFPNSDVNASAPPLMWSISGDQGFTWTTPKTLGVAGVFPTLRTLDNGMVALSYGRYGAKLMFADETGRRWTTPTTVYAGPGSGHTELRKTALGDYAFVYDQSSFYPPSYNAAPPGAYVYDGGESANLKSAILTINPGPATDDFQWLHEYHGDVSPETLPGAGWARTLVGTPLQILSADLGQDYVETITNSAATNRLSYGTNNAGAATDAWHAIDLQTTGAVVDIRARVVGGTSGEGAADLFLGDATGAVSLQISGSAVFLEGAGGNAGQGSFSSQQSPGFSTTHWHSYRVVIGPDFTQAGTVTASVFLDGNFNTPILSRALGAASIDALEFGDRSPTAGGAMDVDFVRFSPFASQWITDGDSNWNNPANWTAQVPNSVGAIARLAGSFSAPRTISLNEPVTVSALRFETATAFTLNGAGTLTLSVAAGTAQIVALAGSHSILTPLEIVSPTTVSGGGRLAFGNVALTAPLAIASDVLAADVEGNSSLTIQSAGSFDARRLRVASLTIAGEAAISPGRSAAKTSRVTSIALGSAARLALGNNDLLIDYTGASPLSQIRSWITTAYDNGSWNGPGIATSLSGDGALLGYAEMNQLNLGTTYNGIDVDGTTILIRYTLAGDADLNGTVDIADFSMVAANFNQSTEWRGGDFNYDSVTNIADFAQLAAHFNQSMPGEIPRNPIPEPASMLALAAITLSGRGVVRPPWRQRRRAAGR